MNLLPGIQTITADGVIGQSGKPVRVFSIHLISAGIPSVLAVHNGTSASGTQILSITGTANTGVTTSFEQGLRFPDGCYVNVDANITNVTFSYTQEF